MFKSEVRVSDLVKQVKKCVDIVPSASASPMYSNIKINFTDSGLDLFATDGDAYVTPTVDTTQTKANGLLSAMFDAKMFNSIVGSFLCKDIVLWYDEKTMKLSMSSAKQEMTIMGKPSEDFPIFPEGSKNDIVEFDMPAILFQKLITNTAWALPEKNVIEMNYFYFRIKSKVISVYTSNRRVLAKYSLANVDAPDCEFILPSKTLQKIAKLKVEADEIVSILAKSDITVICLDDAEYKIRTSASAFPNFDVRLVPLPDNKVKVSAASIENDIKSILPVATEEFCAMTIESDMDEGILELTAKSGETYHGVVKTKVKDMFGSIEGLYSARALLDALNPLSKEVSILADDKKQLFITGGDEVDNFIFTFAPLINRSVIATA